MANGPKRSSMESATKLTLPNAPAFGIAAPVMPSLKGQFSRPAGAGQVGPATPSAVGVGVSPPPKDGNMSFRVDRLGVPPLTKVLSRPKASAITSTDAERVEVGQETGQAEAATPRDVMYIHIPPHALRGFQSFARGVANECRRDNAADNPYVRALCNHRAELQSHSVVPRPTEAPSRCEREASEREALSLMMPTGTSLSEPSSECPPDDERSRSGEAWLTAWPLCGDEGQDARGDSCMLWRCGSAEKEAWSLHVDPVRGVEAGQPGYTAICSGYTPRARPGCSPAGSPLRSVPPKPHQWQANAQSPLSPRVLFPIEQDESSRDGL